MVTILGPWEVVEIFPLYTLWWQCCLYNSPDQDTPKMFSLKARVGKVGRFIWWKTNPWGSECSGRMPLEGSLDPHIWQTEKGRSKHILQGHLEDLRFFDLYLCEVTQWRITGIRIRTQFSVFHGDGRRKWKILQAPNQGAGRQASVP